MFFARGTLLPQATSSPYPHRLSIFYAAGTPPRAPSSTAGVRARTAQYHDNVKTPLILALLLAQAALGVMHQAFGVDDVPRKTVDSPRDLAAVWRFATLPPSQRPPQLPPK